MGKVPGVRARKNKISNAQDEGARQARASIENQPPRRIVNRASLREESQDWDADVQSSTLRNSQAFPEDLETQINYHDEQSQLSSNYDDVSPFDAIPSNNPFSPLSSHSTIPDFNFPSNSGPNVIHSMTPQPERRRVGQLDKPSNTSIDPATLSIPTQSSPHLQTSSVESSNPSQDDADHLQLTSQCMITCADIVNNLETYIASDLKSLDLILGIVKEVMQQLTELVQLQQTATSFRTCCILSVIMHQVVDLLECGCNSFFDKDKPDGRPPFLRAGGSLGFRAFNSKSEEERSWKARIVVRELDQVSELLQKIITLTRFKTVQAIPEMGNSQADCHAELENRLKDLTANMKTIADAIVA